MPNDVDELTRLDEKKEVLAPKGPFESKAQTMVPGPYYAAAEEVLPELEPTEPSVSGDVASAPQLSASIGRRDFMRLFSISALAGAAACVRRPAERSIPYVNQPVDQVPGVATYYATTCAQCTSGCGMVVKTKEGRPIKLEGNKEHPISQGAMCALGQAQLQGLYHPERLKSPYAKTVSGLEKASWDLSYKAIAKKVTASTRVGIFTGGATGHRHDFFKDVLRTLGASESNLYTWEANSLLAAMVKAHDLAFGRPEIPRIELGKARFILGIGSDFLDVGLSPTYHAKNFSESQSYKNGQKGHFVQFETTLSLTGAKADERHVIPAGGEQLVALLLMRALFYKKSHQLSTKLKNMVEEIINVRFRKELETAHQLLGLDNSVFVNLADQLIQQRSVVLAGGSHNFDQQSTQLQLVTILINQMIAAYDTILYFEKGWMRPPIQVGDLQRFQTEATDLDVLFVIGSDPVFTTPESWKLKALLEKIPCVVSMQDFPSDMDQFAHFVLPTHHPLESWGDEQPIDHFWSIRQPVIRATTDSRQAEDVLLWILAHAKKPMGVPDYRTYLTNKWKQIHKKVQVDIFYDHFEKGIIRRGFVGHLKSRAVSELKNVVSHLSPPQTHFSGLKVVSHLDHRLQDGRGAHLPLLQEIGDGLTTIAWDTWAALNPTTMKRLNLKRNQIVVLKTKTGSLKIAVYPLPGLHKDVVVIPRGNGHQDQRSKISFNNGINPLKLYAKQEDPLSGQPVTANEAVELTVTNEWFRLATMQKHNDIANRKDIVKKKSVAALSHMRDNLDLDDVPDVFPKLEKMPYRWGMSIDLDKCNGCGACMAACAIENNVPQVGREQVVMGREMHWVRLDRYFYGHSDNPTVSFQPVMCQHCNHAPCEAVCPVYATTHDPEGLNAMTYNRCVGTRYCANACPYKVRRFNWWTYKWSVIGERLQDRNPRALNPDVTVRTRGVMEKCSLCVGRIRDAKHEAKKQGRQVQDGECQTACQQTCPTGAIQFGNLNDPTSIVSQHRKNRRSYLMLGGEPSHHHYGLKTLPNVSYLCAVTSKEETTHKHAHAEDHG